jgi:L-ascorbate metabolism protein UlaG (beta-lactamase superfamily)
MRRVLVALALLLALAPLGRTEDGGKETKDVAVRWFGQACFELRFPTGLTVLCDPFDAAKIGKYVFPREVKPDLVTISHEHSDHSNDKEVTGSPEVLRGLTSADAKTHDWKKHDVVRKGVHVRTVGVYHDEKEGAERGKNTVFVFEPETKGAFPTIAHFGDLGHVLTDEQVKAIGPVDAILIPVGGGYTIGAEGAKKVIEQLKPRILIIPMHYKTDALDPRIPLAPVDPFVKLFEGRVQKADGNETTVPAGATGEARIVVLDWKKKEGDMPKDAPTIGNARAWVDAMPGGKKPTLHLTADIAASGGPKGGTLVVEAVLSGKKLDLEDDAAGEAQPAGGWKLEAGKKRAFKIVCKDGQTASDGDSIQLTAVVDGARSSGATVSVTVQTVR